MQTHIYCIKRMVNVYMGDKIFNKILEIEKELLHEKNNIDYSNSVLRINYNKKEKSLIMFKAIFSLVVIGDNESEEAIAKKFIDITESYIKKCYSMEYCEDSSWSIDIEIFTRIIEYN